MEQRGFSTNSYGNWASLLCCELQNQQQTGESIESGQEYQKFGEILDFMQISYKNREQQPSVIRFRQWCLFEHLKFADYFRWIKCLNQIVYTLDAFKLLYMLNICLDAFVVIILPGVLKVCFYCAKYVFRVIWVESWVQ